MLSIRLSVARRARDFDNATLRAMVTLWTFVSFLCGRRLGRGRPFKANVAIVAVGPVGGDVRVQGLQLRDCEAWVRSFECYEDWVSEHVSELAVFTSWTRNAVIE